MQQKKTKNKLPARRVIVLGAGQIGMHIMQQMSADNFDVIVIDQSEEAINEASRISDVGTIIGNGTDPQIFMEIGLNERDLFLAVTDSDEVNIVACNFARAFGCEMVIARVRQPFYRNYTDAPIDTAFWKEMGISSLFNQTELTSREIINLLENPGAIETVSLRASDLQINAYRVKEGSLLAGRRLVGLRDVSMFEDLIVAAISTSSAPDYIQSVKGRKPMQGMQAGSREYTIIPRGDYRINVGDLLFICGEKKNFEKLGNLFDPDLSAEIRKIFILGGSVIAHHLAETLVKKYRNKKVYLLEKTKRNAYNAAENLTPDLNVMLTDMHRISDLVDEGLDKDCFFIAASESEDDNLLASLLVKEETGARTIAVIQNTSYLQMVPYLSLDAMVSPKLLLVDDVLKVLRRNVYDVLSAKGHDAEILEFVVHKNSIAAGHSLSEFRFPENSIIVSLTRGGETIVPKGTTEMKPGDHIIVFALKQAIKDVQHLFLKR